MSRTARSTSTARTVTRTATVAAAAFGAVVLVAGTAQAAAPATPLPTATKTAQGGGCAVHVTWNAVPGADHYLAARTLPGMPWRQALQQTQTMLPGAVRTYDITTASGTSTIIQVVAVGADGSLSGTGQVISTC